MRVGGKAAEGIQVSAGPVIVAEQLPDNHFAKKLALEFRAAFLKANNVSDHGGFSAYPSTVGDLHHAAERALKTAKPGTVEFRKAMRDEILNTKELSGVHAVYNFKAGAYYGVDERALVIVRLDNGAWT